MTLNTRFFVIDPINPEKLHAEANRLLSAPESVIIHRTPGHINNGPDQGLDAWVMTTFGADGPLIPDTDTEEDGSGWEDAPHEPYCVEISFDTTYGMTAANGSGCSDLHAWLIVKLAAWLSDNYPDARWGWQSEFTGEYHSGPDAAFAPLEAFGNPARGARVELVSLPS